jgi:tRNA G10  N-methylase Trm11
MKYFFILGNNPSLSIAELNALLNLSNAKLLTPNFLITDLDLEIDADKLIKRLGGVIKIGLIKSETIKNHKELVDESVKLSIDKQKKSPNGKFNFGISSYGVGDLNKKDIGIKTKLAFKELGQSSRFVVSKEKTLSSVVITQNKLIKRGIELVVSKIDDNFILGKTLSVQPFKDLSRRDFGRPARDDHSGMLPPKLAMTMINIATRNMTNISIMDPFCGSGTVLSEAMIMGYNDIYGSDVSKKAVDDTYTNINWVKELYDIKNVSHKLKVKSATKLSQFIKAESIDVIVTEPYLGPQRGMINFKETIDNLENLYSDSISEFNKILKKDGRIVMVWPSFYGQRPITPKINGFKIVNPIPDNLKENKFIKTTNRNTILYGRPGQKVYREIVVLEKE